MHSKKWSLCSIALSVLLSAFAAAENVVPGKPSVNANPTLRQDDVLVYTHSVLDYGAKPGRADFDNTVAFQKAIDEAHAAKGGIVYAPAGTYTFNGSLIVHEGVTLRGEWRDPEINGVCVGTILSIAANHNNESGTAFITHMPNAAVHDLSFWYPKQSCSAPVPYPWTIHETKHYGHAVYNITFINSFKGMIFDTSGGSFYRNIRGTCLKRGMQIADNWHFGHFDNLRFSSKYWIKSALAGSPSNPVEEEALRAYLRNNLFALHCTEHVDGVTIYDIVVEDAAVGISDDSYNGWLNVVRFKLINVKKGILITNSGSVSEYQGGEISVLPGAENYGVECDCQYGIRLHDVLIGGMPACGFYQKRGRVSMLTKVTFLEWSEWGAKVDSGKIVLLSDTFKKDTPHALYLNPDAVTSASITGNVFTGSGSVTYNTHSKEIVIENALQATPCLPAWSMNYSPPKIPSPPKPGNLIVVTDHGAIPGDGTADNTAAFQKALKAAELTGGGIVFVPAGYWRIDGTLTIPSGVELRGANDYQSYIGEYGTVLFAYAGKGDPKGTPFITMQTKSGLRGLTIYYREADWQRNVNYPWTIRAAGSGIWIACVRLANPWNGLDLGTERCDDFVISGLFADPRKIGIWVSHGSENGVIERTNFTHEVDWGLPAPVPGAGKDHDVTAEKAFFLGHTRNLTCFTPTEYDGADGKAAFWLYNDGGRTEDLKILESQCDTYGFYTLYMEDAGNVDLVNPVPYNKGIKGNANGTLNVFGATRLPLDLTGTGIANIVNASGLAAPAPSAISRVSSGTLNMYGVTDTAIVFGPGATGALTGTCSMNISSSAVDKLKLIGGAETLGNAVKGNVMEFVVTNGGGGGNKYWYHSFSKASYKLRAGDFIEYDVKLLDKVSAAGGIDVYLSDGSTLRDIAGWQDQEGIGGHPAGDLSKRAHNTWFHRKLAIPAEAVGKTTSRWTIVGENDDDNITYRAWYKKLIVTDGNGTIRSTAFEFSIDESERVISNGAAASIRVIDESK